METLSIHKTNDTPEVLLDAENKIFKIEGYSMPEDALSFYNPIVSWITEYTSQQAGPMDVKFRMVYFNTASAKQIARVLTIMGNSANASNITITWEYETDDNEMLRSGKRFAQQLGLKFQFVEVEPAPDPDLEPEEVHVRVVKN